MKLSNTILKSNTIINSKFRGKAACFTMLVCQLKNKRKSVSNTTLTMRKLIACSSEYHPYIREHKYFAVISATNAVSAEK